MRAWNYNCFVAFHAKDDGSITTDERNESSSESSIKAENSSEKDPSLDSTDQRRKAQGSSTGR